MITATEFEKQWKTSRDIAEQALLSIAAILVRRRRFDYDTVVLAQFTQLALALDKLADEHEIID